MRYYAEALRLASETGAWESRIEALSGLANLASRAGEHHLAARWLGLIAHWRASTELFEEAHILEWERETIADLRSALGDEAFETLWAEGQELSLETAAAAALSFAAQAVYAI